MILYRISTTEEAQILRFYIWEILHLTIRKMICYVTKFQKKMEDAKKKLQKDDAMEEDEDSNPAKPSEQMFEELEEKLDTAQNVYHVIDLAYSLL
ncbi:hypothetical protein NPIL_495322 [Nephila pilipes]|uniref:MIF4G-like type 2 domain-containing protein n=1 Tax=Nephila pilipes TaxID=299642 RepID=A0A8X6QR80_NEPPI|nr:hypothetical protein NPIL_495322 [Nephila pilipes]